MSPRRTLRGIVLLVGLLGTLVFAMLAAFGVIQWVGVLVPVVMALVGFAWLRRGIQGEAQARAALARRARREVRRPAAPQPASAQDRSVTPADPATRPAAPARRERPAATGTDGVESPVRPVRSDEVFDNAPALSRTKAPAAAFASDPAASRVEPDAVPARPSRARTVDEDDLPLTWEPRVVPLPTYAMKARVEHRLVDETVESTGTAGDQLAELPAWDDDLVALRPRAAHG